MANQPSISEMLTSVQEDIRTIVRGEIELAKVELAPQAKRAGIGAGMFGAAAFVGLLGLILVFVSLSFGVARAFQSWFGMEQVAAFASGFAVMAVLLFLLAGVMVLVGKQRLESLDPAVVADSPRESVASLRAAFTKASGEVAQTPLLGKSAHESLGAPDGPDELPET